MSMYVQLLEAEVRRLRRRLKRKLRLKDQEISDLKDKLDPTRATTRAIQRRMMEQMFNVPDIPSAQVYNGVNQLMRDAEKREASSEPLSPFSTVRDGETPSEAIERELQEDK